MLRVYLQCLAQDAFGLVEAIQRAKLGGNVQLMLEMTGRHFCRDLEPR